MKLKLFKAYLSAIGWACYFLFAVSLVVIVGMIGPIYLVWMCHFSVITVLFAIVCNAIDSYCLTQMTENWLIQMYGYINWIKKIKRHEC